MKIVALLLLTSCACRPLAWSQVLGGLFDQQATELKYYQQQIAYLEIYIGYLEKGYKIAQAGLSEIAAIKKGEFHLHQEFFSALASVSPAIARDDRIAGVLRPTPRQARQTLRVFAVVAIRVVEFEDVPSTQS